MSHEDTEGLFDEVRSRLMLDGLPDYFLRIEDPSQQHGNAAAGHTAMNYGSCLLPIYVGHLRISIVEAKLVKNYGWLPMSLYVRCRVGQNVFETTTSTNGGTTPKWDRSVVCLLPKGITRITIEIYDEKLFGADALIASTVIYLPKEIFDGCCVDDWYPLSGKQGEFKEGKINVIISLLALQTNSVAPAGRLTANATDIESSVDELRKIYPTYNAEFIRDILLDNGGDKQLTASILADMVAQGMMQTGHEQESTGQRQEQTVSKQEQSGSQQESVENKQEQSGNQQVKKQQEPTGNQQETTGNKQELTGHDPTGDHSKTTENKQETT